MIEYKFKIRDKEIMVKTDRKSLIKMSVILFLYLLFLISVSTSHNFSLWSLNASPTTLNTLTMWITAHCGKFFKIWEYQTS